MASTVPETAPSSAQEPVRIPAAAAFWNALTALRYDWIRYPLIVFLVTRLILAAGGYVASVAIQIPPVAWEKHLAPTNIFIDMWVRWDSTLYYEIVTRGYSYQPGQPSNVAFFPVFPLLTSALTPLAGSPALAGLIVTNLSLLIGLITLYRLTVLEFDDANTARRTVFYMAAFPTAFFFTAFYAESVFFVTTVLCVYFVRRRWWLAAGLIGLVASGTRITGILLMGFYGLEWLRVNGWTLDRAQRAESWIAMWDALRHRWLSLLPVFLIPLGIGAFMAYLKATFGNPLAWLDAQSSWTGRENHIPFATIFDDIRKVAAIDYLAPINPIWATLFNLLILAVALLIALAVWRRLGVSYALYMLASLLVPASSGTLSMSRFVLVLFPGVMMLGRWGRWPLVDRLLTGGFCILLGVFTTLFVKWLFVA